MEKFTALTEDEQTAFQMLVDAVKHEEAARRMDVTPGKRAMLMRVQHDGKDRAVVAIAQGAEDGSVFVHPIALLIDGPLFQQIVPVGEPETVTR